MKSFIPFFIIALCIGMYFVYIGPTWSDISDKSTRRDEYTAVLDKVKELKNQRDSLSTKYNNISVSDLDMLNKIIPTKFDPVYFTNDLNAMSSKYGMQVRDMKATYITPTIAGAEGEDVQVGDKKYKVISAKLRLSGRYDQFLSFLKDLETSLRLVDVVDLSIRGGGVSKKGEDVNLDYTLEVQTYSLQ